jgi:hypothetical protein
VLSNCSADSAGFFGVVLADGLGFAFGVAFAQVSVRGVAEIAVVGWVPAPSPTGFPFASAQPAHDKAMIINAMAVLHAFCMKTDDMGLV